MSIINHIYGGALSPSPSKYPANPEYLRMRQELEAMIDLINDSLDESGRELFQDAINLRANIDGIINVDTFETGFKLGAQIMIEVLKSTAE